MQNDLAHRLRQVGKELQSADEPVELISVRLQTLQTESSTIAPNVIETIETAIALLWQTPPAVEMALSVIEVAAQQLEGQAVLYAPTDPVAWSRLFEYQHGPCPVIRATELVATPVVTTATAPLATVQPARTSREKNHWHYLVAVQVMVAAVLLLGVGATGVGLWLSQPARAPAPTSPVLVLTCRSANGDTFIPGLGLYHATLSGTFLVPGVSADAAGLCVTLAGHFVELTCFQDGGACAPDIELRPLAGAKPPNPAVRARSALAP